LKSNKSQSFIIYSYGFSLTEQNKFDSLKIRVVIGTAPEGKVENAEDLFPS